MKKNNKNPDSEIKLLQKRIATLEKIDVSYKELEKKFSEAHEYAQNIVETVRESLLIIDGNLKVISANKAFYKGFKVSPKKTQGQFIYDLGNRQWDIPKLRQLLKEVITKKNTFDGYEISHKFETIGQKIMLLNARRIPPTPAKPRMILLAIEDVTEYKKAEEILQASENRLKLEISRMPFAHIIWDKDFRVVAWNSTAEKIFGFKFNEVKGKRPYETIIPLEAKSQVKNIWSKLLTGSTSTHSENKNITKKGRIIVCDWTNTPLKQPDGTIIGVMSMVQDVTETKKLQEEITSGLKEKVAEKTKKLDAVNKQLNDKIYELEIFNKAAVGRELKIIELEKEVGMLRKKI